MTTFIEQAVTKIDDRVLAVREEMARLEAARAVLQNVPAKSEPRRRRQRVTVAPVSTIEKRQVRRRGEFEADVLNAIRARPGITGRQIAETLDVHFTAPYMALRRLSADGRIRRVADHGWEAS